MHHRDARELEDETELNRVLEQVCHAERYAVDQQQAFFRYHAGATADHLNDVAEHLHEDRSQNGQEHLDVKELLDHPLELEPRRNTHDLNMKLCFQSTHTDVMPAIINK
jgi:hypothetical protein